MSLLKRIESARPGGAGPAPAPGGPPAPSGPGSPAGGGPSLAPAQRLLPTAPVRESFRDVKFRIQSRVISDLDPKLDLSNQVEVRRQIEEIFGKVIDEEGLALTRAERVRMLEQITDEIIGLGPLEPLLRDESITEIMVNGPRQVYIERNGKLELTNVVFQNDDHVMRIIDRIIAPIGRRVDESSPMVDARLTDGSRVNAIIPPLSLVGPVITIRKFAASPFTVDDLIRFGTATPEMFDFLKACVEARLNLFVSGGTGSGKTTTLNVLSSFIPNDERIITIEDAAELQLRQEHVVTLEARPQNLEGQGEITIRDLLRNALHMRPDRIIVGECRGGEALDMIQAMTVGQEGSLSTGHANSPPDMLRRLETMVLMAGVELPLRSIREQIASAVDLIVHTARLKDGSRKVVNITEVFGIEEDDILMEDVFVYEQTGVVDGKIEGILKPTGIRPTFMGRFKQRGIDLPPGEFGIPPEDPAHPTRQGKGRWVIGAQQSSEGVKSPVAIGRAVKAGGMVYVSSMGPIDPVSGFVVHPAIKEQTRQCLENLKAKLEAEGSSLEKIVWANWALRDPTEFEAFNEEWAHWFPGDTPVGQGTLMPPLQRRAGFRISIAVIAEA
jgi:pilus assembly protein CpaF